MVVRLLSTIVFRRLCTNEKRSDSSLQSEQSCLSPHSFLCALLPRFSFGTYPSEGSTFLAILFLCISRRKTTAKQSLFLRSNLPPCIVAPPYSPDRPPLMVKGLYYKLAIDSFLGNYRILANSNSVIPRSNYCM